MNRLPENALAQYESDGYVLVPGFFRAEEIEPLRRAWRADPSLGGALLAIADSAGNAREVVPYTELSNDLAGIVPRLARVVSAAETLLGEPRYHRHSKLSMKRPGSEGTWEEAHAHRPLEINPDAAILDGAYDTIYGHQVIITQDRDEGYGDKVLRAATRPNGQRPRMGVARSL